MPRRTNPFQQLIALIMFSIKGFDYEIKESVLTSKDMQTGSIREMDIILINKKNPTDKILIECRNHKRKQSVEWIDSLVGKALRLGYRRVIAVSSSGFYKPAILEAEERNIETLTLREAEDIDWKSWFFNLRQISIEKISHARIKIIIIYNKAGKKFLVNNPANARFLKISNKEWITVLDFIRSQTKQILNDFEERRKPNEGTKIIYEVPLVDLLFQFKRDDEMQVAKRLEVHIEEYNDTFLVPLKAYRLGDEKLLIDETILKNSKYRLVLNIKNQQLQIAVEENNEGFSIS